MWELGGWKIRHRVACQGDIDEAALFHVSLKGCIERFLLLVSEYFLYLHLKNERAGAIVPTLGI